MKLTDKLRDLTKTKNMNRREFSEAVGIPYSTIDNWYKRGYENMSIATLKIICDFFGVTMESMAYDEKEIEYRSDRAMEYSTAEADLIRGYRAASEEIQDNMRYQARTALIKKKDDTGTSSDSAAG